MIHLRGVYKKHALNILESFFILNICLVFLINAYEDSSEVWAFVLSHLLVFSAFLVFLGIVAYHAYLRCSQFGCIKKLRIKPRNEDVDFDRHIIGSMRGYEPIERIED